MRNVESRQRLAHGAAALVSVDAGKFKHAVAVRRGLEDFSRPEMFDTTRAGFDAALAYIERETGGAAPADVLVGIEFGGRCGITFAQYLDQRGYRIVTVRGYDVKQEAKKVTRRKLKSDKSDAKVIGIVLQQGNFLGAPFLAKEYAVLRSMLSTVERLTLQRSAGATRIRAALHVSFPEFEAVMGSRSFTANQTPLKLLEAFPGPRYVLEAGRERVLEVIRKASRGQSGEELCDALMEAAAESLAYDVAGEPLALEIRCLVRQLHLFTEQRAAVEAAMSELIHQLPETKYLLSIPSVGTLTAAMFLGSVGDLAAYSSVRQVIAMAGMGLTTVESGTHVGRTRLSKEGRPVMRRYMYLLATRLSLPEGAPYRPRYDELRARGKGMRQAMTAIARSLLRTMYAVASRREMYDPARMSRDSVAE